MKFNKQLIPIFVLTLKDSSREKIIRTRLEELKLRYKIFYGVNAKLKKNINFLNKIYDKKRALQVLERDLDLYDLACAYGHIKIYNYIARNRVQNSIIMEDDCFPSETFKEWVLIKKSFLNNLDFVQFYSNSGLIFKKPDILLNKKFSIHKASTHLPLMNCYQINLKSCKFLLKYFNKKIFQTSDFPAEYFNKKIKQFFVTPIMAGTHINHFRTSTNKKIWSSVKILSGLRKLVPAYSLFNALIHISHIFFLFNKQTSYRFYKLNFLNYKIEILKNFFHKNYLNLSDLINNKNIYSKDIRKKID